MKWAVKRHCLFICYMVNDTKKCILPPLSIRNGVGRLNIGVEKTRLSWICWWVTTTVQIILEALSLDWPKAYEHCCKSALQNVFFDYLMASLGPDMYTLSRKGRPELNFYDFSKKRGKYICILALVIFNRFITFGKNEDKKCKSCKPVVVRVQII